MDIKSKNTDRFKGLISWLSLLLVLCTATLGVISVLRVIFDPELAYQINAIYEYQQSTGEIPYTLFYPALCVLGLFILALLFIFLFRQDRLAFQAALARFFSRLWVEVKLFLICTSVLLLFSTGNLEVLVVVVVLIFYFFCLDVSHNRHFFRHNMVHSLLLALNDYRNMPTFERRSLRRLASCIAVILAVLSFTVIALSILLSSQLQGLYRLVPLLGTLAFGVAGIVGTVFWYSLALRRDLKDWDVLMEQIAKMYGGDLDAVNQIPPTSNLYHCAMQLNMIRTGIQKAVEEGTKADRTKVELITNVSHDIKTPLTSIISYIDLLKKEEHLPDYVKDYISTISLKADRLSSIVQDVFDVSKAATGNINLHLEDLDIGKLLQQTFGEIGEQVEASSLSWKVSTPDVPVLVHADGQRLYRVFQNLIRNCIQYSLENSRVYVTVSAAQGMAQVSIRNISRSELNLQGDDLTARFVRGDQNRTTEGSGLGLSIAKSFTEACGGQFQIEAHDDLFVVTVSFPQVQKVLPEPLPLP